MIKATANTNVRAVLQHGGGLVHTLQPRAHARGRQLTPRGGVINRRCGATSIIPLPFPSSVAAVYPLTGVRRARKLSPSLRSNNRPHAQLVVGYTQDHQLSLKASLNHLHSSLVSQDSSIITKGKGGGISSHVRQGIGQPVNDTNPAAISLQPNGNTVVHPAIMLHAKVGTELEAVAIIHFSSTKLWKGHQRNALFWSTKPRPSETCTLWRWA